MSGKQIINALHEIQDWQAGIGTMRVSFFDDAGKIRSEEMTWEEYVHRCDVAAAKADHERGR